MQLLFRLRATFLAIGMTAMSALADTSAPVVQFTLNAQSSSLKGLDSLRQTRVAKGDELTLRSSDGFQEQFNIISSKLTKSGNRIIRGRSEFGADLLLGLNSQGELHGSVLSEGEYYQLRAHDDRLTIIRTESQLRKRATSFGSDRDFAIDRPLITKKRGLPRYEGVLKNPPSVAASFPVFKTGWAQIDVLVYHQAGFTDDPALLIDIMVEYANGAFADSQVDLTLNIVGVLPLEIPVEDQSTLLPKMRNGQAPFSSIGIDRNFYDADLIVALLNDVPEDDDACGVANVGVQEGIPWRGAYAATVLWKPAGLSSSGTFCTNSTFAHEIGHLLGSQHERRIEEPGDVGAYPFSFGHAQESTPRFKTIMSYGDEYEAPVFSNPRSDACRGSPCGVTIGNEASADNATGFNNVRHMLAGYQSTRFTYELLNDFPFEEACETDSGTDGLYRGHFVSNDTQWDIEIYSLTYRLQSGDTSSYTYRSGDVVIAAGEALGDGECIEITAPHFYGGEVVESWITYVNPVSGQLVESVHLEWDDDYSGEYDLIRIASSEGGASLGHSARRLRRGESAQIEFVAEPGFQLAGVSGTCEGTLTDSTFNIHATTSTCSIEAAFESSGTTSETFKVRLEEPVANSVYSGVGNLRGWSVATAGVDRIEIYIDDVYVVDVPYGGQRDDVGDLNPEIEGADLSGFSMAYNYNLLDSGEHRITARSINQNGQSKDATTVFTVAKFHSPFFPEGTALNLNVGQCSAARDEISVVGALLDGKPYDILLKWRTPTQGFEIIEVD